MGRFFCGTNQKGVAWSAHVLAGFARWDPTHTILDIADARYAPGSDGVSVAGAALVALSDRGSGGETPTPPEPPANLRRLDVRP